MQLIIDDVEGCRSEVPFRGDELTIGRAASSSVHLAEKNVSRRHARIARGPTGFLIEDLQSFTGVRVNGERVHGSRALRPGDLVQIGDYKLTLQADPAELAALDEPTSPGGGAAPPAVAPERNLAGRLIVLAVLIAAALATVLWILAHRAGAVR